MKLNSIINFNYLSEYELHGKLLEIITMFNSEVLYKVELKEEFADILKPTKILLVKESELITVQ